MKTLLFLILFLGVLSDEIYSQDTLTDVFDSTITYWRFDSYNSINEKTI